jgi:hypothetical protein
MMIHMGDYGSGLVDYYYFCNIPCKVVSSVGKLLLPGMYPELSNVTLLLLIT